MERTIGQDSKLRQAGQFVREHALELGACGAVLGFAGWTAVTGHLKNLDQSAGEDKPNQPTHSLNIPSKNTTFDTSSNLGNSPEFLKMKTEAAILEYLIPRTTAYMEGTGDELLRLKAGRINEIASEGKITVISLKGEPSVVFGPDHSESPKFSPLIGIPLDWGIRQNYTDADRAFALIRASIIYDLLLRYDREQLAEFGQLAGSKVPSGVEEIAMESTKRIIGPIAGELEHPWHISRFAGE